MITINTKIQNELRFKSQHKWTISFHWSLKNIRKLEVFWGVLHETGVMKWVNYLNLNPLLLILNTFSMFLILSLMTLRMYFTTGLHWMRIWQIKINLYLLNGNNRNTRKRCEICEKLTTKTPERCHRNRSGVFTVNFEHISHLFLVFLLLTRNKPMLAGIWQVDLSVR